MAVGKLIKVTTLGAVLLLLLPLVFGACAPAQVAEKPEDFFKGKTVTLMPATKAGSGTDLLTRLVAPYLQEYLGARAVVVENVPEGAGIGAANKVWNATPDGLSIAVYIPNSIALADMSGLAGVQYKVEKFNWLFGLTSEAGLFLDVYPKGPYKSVADLQKAKSPLRMGGSDSKALRAGFFAEILGFPAKVTSGISGEDARMALIRGEIDYYVESPGGSYERSQAGEMMPLAVDRHERHPLFPNVPAIAELANLTSQQKKWVELNEVEDQGKWVFTSPGVPADRVKYLRDTFEKIHNDSRFMNDRWTKFSRWPMPEPWLKGTQCQEIITKYKANAKEVEAMGKYFVDKYFTVK